MHRILLFVIASTFPAAAFAQTATTCSPATLNGVYSLTLSSRQLNSTLNLTLATQQVGTAVFDGQSSITIIRAGGTTAPGGGQKQTLTGTYTLPASCSGTITFVNGLTLTTLNLEVYSHGNSFSFAGSDGKGLFSGSGTLQPAACVVSTYSGSYAFTGNGFLYTNSGAITGGDDVTGLLQFDGQGNVTGNWTSVTGAASTPVTASGTYTVSDCGATATLADASKTTYTFVLAVTTAAGSDFDFAASTSTGATTSSIFSGAAHSLFVNPGLSVVNAASNTSGQTTPGSIFTVYGTGLATKEAQPSAVPLLTTVLTTTVTVNGEPAPIFYENPTQINAQLPADIKPGLATVIVKNGSALSNAVAVVVPSGASPGIFVYGQNRAVAVNPDGNVNSTATPAHVGDVVTAYFTAGGPVQPPENLLTGAPSPLVLSPVAGVKSIKLGTADAVINYVGLTPGSIGLYQANFVVPQLGKGDHALTISIGGQPSNAPLIAVSGN